MPDRYAEVRRREHSTFGDAIKRHRRDTDAFTAGAQYALDNLLSGMDGFGPRVVGAMITDAAADILANVHKGNL